MIKVQYRDCLFDILLKVSVEAKVLRIMKNQYLDSSYKTLLEIIKNIVPNTVSCINEVC